MLGTTLLVVSACGSDEATSAGGRDGGASGSGGATSGSGGVTSTGGATSDATTPAARRFIRDTANGLVTDVKVDAAGNLYVAGSILGKTVDLGMGPIAIPSAGFALGFVASLDPSGRQRWAAPVEVPDVPSSWTDPSARLALAPNGNVFVFLHSTEHVYLTQWSPDGSMGSIRHVRGFFDFRDLLADNDVVYAAGKYVGSIDFGCGDLFHSTDGSDEGGAFVKLSASDFTCVKSNGWSPVPGPMVTAMTFRGSDLVVVGEHGAPFTLGTVAVSGSGSFIASLTRDGDATWAHAFDGSRTSGVGTDPDGRLIVSGMVQYASPDLKIAYTNAATVDYVARFSAEGVPEATVVVPHGFSNYTLWSGFADGAGHAAYLGNQHATDGGASIYGFHVVRFDSSLAIQDDQEFDYDDIVDLWSLATGKDGSAVVGGVFYGTVDFGDVTLKTGKSQELGQPHGFVAVLPRR